MSRLDYTKFVKRYISQQLAQWELDKCPFCESSNLVIFEGRSPEDGQIGCEIGHFGNQHEPGWGHADVGCRDCFSYWTEKFEVRRIGRCDGSNEFLLRDKMHPDDITRMEQDGWVWDNDGWIIPREDYANARTDTETRFAHIPESKLRSDLAEAELDIGVCQRALTYGVTQHRDGFPVQDRIKGNEHQIKVIKQELADRGLSL